MLLIFDCDGVLIDSEPYACMAGEAALAEFGITMSATEIGERFTGWSFTSMIAELERLSGKVLGEPFARRDRELLFEIFSRHLQPIPGIAETLAVLPQRRCVASSSDPERLEFTLGLTGLHAHFAPHIYSSTMVARGKPAPDLFWHAASEMGAEPTQCIVVEDSRAGVQAGVAAGMTVIGFLGGSHITAGHDEVLRQAGAHHLIATMAELPVLIGQLG
jgi:HAD superfamily hydrolase (TIGR01509 family)